MAKQLTPDVDLQIGGTRGCNYPQHHISHGDGLLLESTGHPSQLFHFKHFVPQVPAAVQISFMLRQSRTMLCLFTWQHTITNYAPIQAGINTFYIHHENTGGKKLSHEKLNSLWTL